VGVKVSEGYTLGEGVSIRIRDERVSIPGPKCPDTYVASSGEKNPVVEGVVNLNDGGISMAGVRRDIAPVS